MWRVCGLIGLIVVSVWRASNTLYLTLSSTERNQFVLIKSVIIIYNYHHHSNNILISMIIWRI